MQQLLQRYKYVRTSNNFEKESARKPIKHVKYKVRPGFCRHYEYLII